MAHVCQFLLSTGLVAALLSYKLTQLWSEHEQQALWSRTEGTMHMIPGRCDPFRSHLWGSMLGCLVLSVRLRCHLIFAVPQMPSQHTWENSLKLAVG